MEGFILAVGIIASFWAIVSFLISAEGTKGIANKPYKTKSGVTHTARKSREKHIV